MNHRSRKLRSHRRRSAFSQGELAFLLGLTNPTAISRYESGERTPDLKTAFAYQTVFGRKITKLFPELLEQARSELRARAEQLSEQIKRRGDSPKAHFKLQQLERLANYESHDEPRV